MSELYFLRHGQRIDHALKEDPNATPIVADYQPYDPSLSTLGLHQTNDVADEIISLTHAFDTEPAPGNTAIKKNIFIHFSPYLRCCQTADALITELKPKLQAKYPNYKIRFQLLGDFALSEWIHEKMSDKPPFIDSNDAYNMYIPNVKQLKNKSACSNFRPTISLGQFNGPNLTYKDYQFHIKTYFKKLLATYDKPAYIKNKDIIIVVSHGYVINNFLSYFINHPIFEEIPEAALNYARIVDNEDGEDGEHTWKLFKDALNFLDNEDLDSTLNLETDIIYYKTNFIKKEDYLQGNTTTPTSTNDSTDDDRPTSLNISRPNLEPRTSFKVKTAQPQVRTTHICSAAKDWTPEASKALQFKIKSEFKMKVMNDESFKKAFDIQNHPSHPVTPEVSPNSEPSRQNSVVDLTKLMSNTEINQPFKLKYSHTGDIPIHRLNSKVNSQVNLAALNRSNSQSSQISSKPLQRSNTSSSNSSSVDLSRRRRSNSNPNAAVLSYNTKDSYFPSTDISKVRSIPSDLSLDDELDIIKESHEPLTLNRAKSPETDEVALWDNSLSSNSLIGDLNRSRSLNQKKSNSTGKSLLAMYQHTQFHNDPVEAGEDESNDSINSNSNSNSNSNVNSRLFSLGFNNYSNSSNYFHTYPHNHPNNKSHKPSLTSSSPPPVRTRSRKNSLKFIPSVIRGDSNDDASKPTTSTEKGVSNSAEPNNPSNKTQPKKKYIFYNLNSDDSGNSDSDSESDNSKEVQKKNNQYIWFGQNRD